MARDNGIKCVIFVNQEICYYSLISTTTGVIECSEKNIHADAKFETLVIQNDSIVSCYGSDLFKGKFVNPL